MTTYTAAIRALIEDQGYQGHEEANYEILHLASEVDRLTKAIVSDSTRMAERFAEYALRAGKGHVGDPPTGWSSLRDIEKSVVRREAILVGLFATIRVVYGVEVTTAIGGAVSH